MKTAELSGVALDWAVAKADGHDMAYFQVVDAFMPSTDWAQGGPIIEREGIALFLNGNDEWAATDGIKNAVGDAPLIAAMRCYVASKLGDEVETPFDLEVAE